MVRFKRDPLGDPVVMSWDAYVAGDPSASARSSQQTYALIETLDSAMVDVEPDADFLASLERRLLGFNVQTVAAVASPVGPMSRPVPPNEPPVHRRFAAAFGQPSHWAIAALLVLFLAGAAVLAWSKQDEPDSPQSIPAVIDEAHVAATPESSPAPSSQSVSLLDIDVVPADLDGGSPSIWNSVEFAEVHVRPGESFSTGEPYFSCCDGIAVYQVQEGSLRLTVEGPADVYRAGAIVAERVDANTAILLGPGESAAFALEHAANVENAGTEELTLIGGYVAASGEKKAFEPPVPNGYGPQFMVWDHSLTTLNSDSVEISFERITLVPGGIYNLEVSAGDRRLGWYQGFSNTPRWFAGNYRSEPDDVEGTNISSFVLGLLSPGPYTVFNPHDEDIIFYLMGVTETGEAGPAPATPEATPIAQAQAAETLLDIQVNPGDLGATTSDLWDTMEFEMVYVNAGESFNTDHPYFTCCAGIVVYQILEGSASFIVESDADVYAAGEWSTPTRIPAGTLFPLGAGETAVFVMDQPAIVTNTGTEELAMLRGSGEQFIGPITSLTPDGYRGGAWATDGSMDPLPGEVVNVSFERVELDPGALFHLETTAGERLVGFSPEADTRLRMLIGDFDAIPADNQGFLLRSYVMGDFSPGPFTFHNAGDLPVTLYLMWIEEVAPVSPAGSPGAIETGPETPVASPVVEVQPHETLLDIQVDPAELNANPLSNWDSMEFALVHVNPGESFSTDSPYFACCVGLATFQVLEGSASFVAESDADVYSAGEWSTPTRIPAGTLFSLSPGETATFAMEIPAVVTNTGTEELVMLGAYSYFFRGPVTTDAPDGYLDNPWVSSSPFDPLPGDRVQLQLERIALDPGELTHIETDPDDGLVGWYPETNAVVRMTKGAVTTPEDPFDSSHVRTIAMSKFPEETYTFSNEGDNPATLYLFRISPVSADPAAASPVAGTAPQPHENLLDIQVLPAEFGAAPLSSWDQMEFSLVKVNPGESFATDHPFFSCCDGIATFQVQEGSASFIVDGPADIYSATGDQPPARVEAGNLFVLNAGQTAVFAMKQPAVITNTGADELVMLGGHAYFVTTHGSAEARPDGYRDPTYEVLTVMKQLTGEAVEIELERVSLAPGEYTHVDVLEDERFIGWHPELNTTVRIAPGALDSLPDGLLDSTMIHSLTSSNQPPGMYTVFNTGKNPATLHFMRIAPVSPGSDVASPIASATPDVASPEALSSGMISETSATYQPLSILVIDPAVIPIGDSAAWNETRFELTYLEAGESYEPDSNSANCCRPGLSGIQVINGLLDIELAGPALITRAGNLSNAETLPEAGTVTLRPGESIWYGLEASPRLVNNGQSRSSFLKITANEQAVPQAGETAEPPTVDLLGVAADTVSTALDTGPVMARVYEMSLGPHSSVPFGVRSGEPALAVVAEGTIHYYEDSEGQGPPSDSSLIFTPGAENGVAFHSLQPGIWTIENREDTHATVYLLRLTSNIPVPVDEAGYNTVLNAVVKPSVHAFGADTSLDEAYFADVTLEPHASLSSTDPVFGCCNGVHTITVIEGEVAFQSSGLISATLMGDGGVGPEGPQTLRAGESAMYEGHLIATNNTDTRVRMLIGGVYAAEIATPVSVDPESGVSILSSALTTFSYDLENVLQSHDIARVTIAPGQQAPLSVTPNDALMLLASGGPLQVVSQSGSSSPIEITGSLSGVTLESGEYVLSNSGSSEVTVYTLRIGPDLAPPDS